MRQENNMIRENKISGLSRNEDKKRRRNVLLLLVFYFLFFFFFKWPSLPLWGVFGTRENWRPFSNQMGG